MKFGNLALKAQFKRSGTKFVKVSRTHAMDSQGKMREFGPNTVVDLVKIEKAAKPVNAGKLAAELEIASRELAKLAAA